MNPYTWLCSNILFPVHEHLKGHDSVGMLKRLEMTQWWTRGELQQEQIRRLRSFLVTIGQNVPYYRALFASRKFDPTFIDRVSDLCVLPRLGKAEIRANLDDLKARGATGLKRYNTGGSSGEPLVFFTSRDRRSHDVAAKWRATRWWDVDIGDPEMVVWGSPLELSAQDRMRGLRDRLMRSMLLPAFDMSVASLDGYIQCIRANRPRMLFGYPSSLALIASHARRRGVRLDNIGIKVAFVTSERLYEDQRDTIGSVFGCRVANGYGGRDAGFIAHECPAGRMHISAEDIVIELLDHAGNPVVPGQRGEIVVTHMATEDFPFVRYATGDWGALDTDACPCGRGLPVLKEIEGRSTDFVVASDGSVMHGLALIYILRDHPEIEQFKIIQHDILHIEILLVVGPDYRQSAGEEIRNACRDRLGKDVEVQLSEVRAIPREASGKFRYVVSHVGIEFALNTQRDAGAAHQSGHIRS